MLGAGAPRLVLPSAHHQAWAMAKHDTVIYTTANTNSPRPHDCWAINKKISQTRPGQHLWILSPRFSVKFVASNESLHFVFAARYLLGNIWATDGQLVALFLLMIFVAVAARPISRIAAFGTFENQVSGATLRFGVVCQGLDFFFVLCTPSLCPPALFFSSTLFVRGYDT